MDDNVKIFLESGQLELFVHGMLDETDQVVVRKFISDNPEVKAEYVKLQDQLESTAISQSLSVPPRLKSEIISKIDEIEKGTTITKQLNMAKVMAIAASFLALMFAVTTWYTYEKNKKTENQYAILAESCNENAIIIDKQASLISFYESSGTKKLEFEGNQLDNEFKSIAYINTEMGKLQYLPGINPKISEKKCLQLWGDLNGEMIPIAVLENDKSGSFSINPRYTSLNITIENKTVDGKGQIHPDVSQLLASVTL